MNIVAIWIIFLAARMLLLVPTAFINDSYSFTFPLLGSLSAIFSTFCLIKRKWEIEKISLVIILLCGPVLIVFHLIQPKRLSLISGCITTLVSCICTIVLHRKAKQITFNKSHILRKIIVGFIVGIVICLIIDVVLIIMNYSLKSTNVGIAIIQSLIVFLLQICTAPVFEEPLFRGSILLLSDSKMRIAAIFIQALLFFVGHLYYLGKQNLDLFILVPICGILFGYTTYKTKSILPSIISHGFVNAFYRTFL